MVQQQKCGQHIHNSITYSHEYVPTDTYVDYIESDSSSGIIINPRHVYKRYQVVFPWAKRIICWKDVKMMSKNRRRCV